MLRPIATLAVLALAALFTLRFVVGVATGLAGFLIGVLFKLAVVVGVIYLVMRVVSPDTAKKVREHWTGPGA
jgi:hypothetical protein